MNTRTDRLRPPPPWAIAIAVGLLTSATAAEEPMLGQDATGDLVSIRHDWSQWRGPDRSNVSLETGLLQEWPTNGPPLLWTLTGLGTGITATAVANGNAYTLGYQDGVDFLFCLDAATGESRWVSQIGPAAGTDAIFMQPLMRWLSPRVPTVDADRIYTITATGVLTCLRTTDGRVLWTKSYPNDFLSPPRIWGFCDYPLVDGDTLICIPGGPGATVVALNKRSGALLWKTAVPGGEAGSYAATVVSLFTADLSGADAIAVYLPSNLLERLLPQFSKLKPGARIVSHQFPIPGQRPATSLDLVSNEDGDLHRILLWKTPLNRGAP